MDSLQLLKQFSSLLRKHSIPPTSQAKGGQAVRIKQFCERSVVAESSHVEIASLREEDVCVFGDQRASFSLWNSSKKLLVAKGISTRSKKLPIARCLTTGGKAT